MFPFLSVSQLKLVPVRLRAVSNLPRSEKKHFPPNLYACCWRVRLACRKWEGQVPIMPGLIACVMSDYIVQTSFFSRKLCMIFYCIFVSWKIQLCLVNNSKLPDTHWARSQHRPAQHCMRSTHWLSTGEIGACMRGQCNSCKSIAWFCSVCWRLNQSEKWM